MNMFCYLSSSPPPPFLFPPSFLITCVCNTYHKHQAPLVDGGGGPKTNWQEQKSEQVGLDKPSALSDENLQMGFV